MAAAFTVGDQLVGFEEVEEKVPLTGVENHAYDLIPSVSVAFAVRVTISGGEPKFNVAGFGGLPVIDEQDGGVFAPTVIENGGQGSVRPPAFPAVTFSV